MRLERLVLACCCTLQVFLPCAAISCQTTYSGRTTDRDAECPGACPYWAEISNSTPCLFMCVPDVTCGNEAFGFDAADHVADTGSKICRGCQMLGCVTCDLDGKSCQTCDDDHSLADGKCKWDYAMYYWAGLFVVSVLFIYLIGWYVDLLCCRRAVNREGLRHGLMFRNECKLYTTPLAESKVPLHMRHRIGEPWPLLTNLATTMVAGSGFVLHMRWQALWLLWNLILLIGWLIFAAAVDTELLFLGWYTADTPRELCYVATRNVDLDKKYNWVRIVFLSVAYVFTTIFSLVSALHLKNLHTRLDVNVSMADFMAVCKGIPEIDGTQPVEEELKALITEATGKECVGVSVCWSYFDRQAEVAELVENRMVLSDVETKIYRCIRPGGQPLDQKDNLRWKLYGPLDRILCYHVIGAPVERVPLVRTLPNDVLKPICLGRDSEETEAASRNAEQAMDNSQKGWNFRKMSLKMHQSGSVGRSASEPAVEAPKLSVPTSRSQTIAQNKAKAEAKSKAKSKAKAEAKSKARAKAKTMRMQPGKQASNIDSAKDDEKRLTSPSSGLEDNFPRSPSAAADTKHDFLFGAPAGNVKASIGDPRLAPPKEGEPQDGDRKSMDSQNSGGSCNSRRSSRQVEAESVELIRSLKTSKYAFVVFNYEADRDAAVEIVKEKGGIPYRGGTLHFKNEESEPEGVYWDGFGLGRARRRKRFSVACGAIFAALMFWLFCFYIPYAGYIASYVYDTGQKPTGLTYYGFVCMIVAANLSLYFLCAICMALVGFTKKADKERWYLTTYSIAIYFNVLLDVLVTYFMSYSMMKASDASTKEGVLISELDSWVKIFDSYPMQRTLGYQMFLYCFPSTFFMPFIGEGVGAITIPWHLQRLIVVSRADLIGRWAERAMMIFLPMDMGRYADIALNIILAAVMFYFPMGFFLPTLFCLLISHIYIYAYDHYRTLRCTEGFNLGSYKIDLVAQMLMALPCAVMLSTIVYKTNCTDGECLDQDAVAILGIGAFVLHVLVHWAFLRLVIPRVAAKSSDSPMVSYEECALGTPCTWFSANPLFCLRSLDYYKHATPCCFFVHGRDHRMWASPELGQHFSYTPYSTE